MEIKRRAYSGFNVKNVDDQKRVIYGVATTPSPDRVGDVIDPLGVEFKNPVPFLWQHNAHHPIGVVSFEEVTEEGIRFRAELPVVSEAGKLKDRIDEAWQCIKLGIVRAVSVGFRPIDYSPIKDGGFKFSRCEILELSAVTVPANAEAVITNIRKGMNAETIAALRKLDITDTYATNSKKGTVIRPGASGPLKEKYDLRSKERLVPNKISDRIAALENTKLKSIKKMEEILDRPGGEGRTTDDAEQEEFDALNANLRAIEADLERYRSLEKAYAEEARPVAGSKSSIPTPAQPRVGPIKVKSELAPGVKFARYGMTLAAAKGNIMQAQVIAESKFPGDDDLKTILKSAVTAGNTANPEWAGSLVAYNEITSDFIEFLRPRTIIGQLGRNGKPSLRRIPFNVHIKGQSASGKAKWVGEGQAKPVMESKYFDTYLGWAKLAGISVITDELLKFSDPAAETLVRDDLANSVIAAMDEDFVNPDKAPGTGTSLSPASIIYGVDPIISSGSDAISVRQDITRLWEKPIANKMPVASAFYITDSRTALQLNSMRNALEQRSFPDVGLLGGSIDGIPLVVSDYVPTSENGSLFILAFASEIYLADDGMVTLTASNEATIEMDTDPEHNSTDPKGAKNFVSMFQTNSIALRAERYVNWSKRREHAASYLKDVNWGAKEPGS